MAGRARLLLGHAGTAETKNTRDEFAELLKVSTNGVDLTGWRFKGDAEFNFAPGTVSPPGGVLLIVGFDPTIATNLAPFCANYGLAPSVAIVGPYAAKLANSTFDVEIAYPALIGRHTNYVNVDKVEYRDSSPWPTSPDGNGKSLQRASSSVIGNTAANWSGNPPTPGATNLGVITALTIATTSPLPGGVIGVACTNEFLATGGATPYAWRLAGGTLPGARALPGDDVLSDATTNAGTFSFTMRVMDHVGAIAEALFTMAIRSHPPTLTLLSCIAGSFQFRMSGDKGPNYAIEASTNLLNWATSFTTNGPVLPFEWTDSDAGQRAGRFDRGLLSP